MILNTIPTIIECATDGGHPRLDLWPGPISPSPQLTITAYVWFTIRASDWRIDIRRGMNASDAEANSKAIDSLLNFETVKYFGNEEMEARRFDQSMAAYEKGRDAGSGPRKGLLNFGQVVIFSLGMMAMMAMSALAIRVGHPDGGRFRLHQCAA